MSETEKMIFPKLTDEQIADFRRRWHETLQRDPGRYPNLVRLTQGPGSLKRWSIRRALLVTAIASLSLWVALVVGFVLGWIAHG